MRIYFPPGGGTSPWLQQHATIGDLPAVVPTGIGSVSVVLNDGSGNIAGMVWNGTTWVQAFGPAIVASVLALPKDNYTAITDPTINDDVGDGYTVGSEWINLTSDSVWQCTDATAGAAVWKRLDNLATAGLQQKSGAVLAAGFTGNPRTATVTFSTAFPSSNYSVEVTAQTSSSTGKRYAPVVVARSASAFTISLGSSEITDLVSVSWTATAYGET